MLFQRLCFSALLTMLALSCHADRSDDEGLVIYAAASTAGVIETLAGRYEEQFQTPSRINTASTSILARQIESGAAADVFLAADRTWMDYLSQAQGVAVSNQIFLLSNRLVIATRSDSNLMVDWEDEKHLHNLFFGRWVMADPDHVPAGRYGKQALENLGCWDNLKNRLIPALDAAAAANILALGEVPVGLLYNTDVCNNPALRVAATLPESVHEPIIYPVAAMSNSQSARQFVKFLAAEPQLKLFRAHGFQIVKGR